MHAQQGRFEAAEQALRQALALDDGHVEAAAALACVARLSARRARLLDWKWPTTAIAAALVVAFVRPLDPATGTPAPDAAPLAVAPAGDDRASTNASAAVVKAAVSDPLLLDEHATVVAALRGVEAARDIRLATAMEDGRVTVRISGTVPTRYVAGLVRAAAASRVGVDAGSLRVDGRYRVKAGDTLFDLGRALYGESSAWHVIWQANRARLDNPHRLRPGVILEVP